MRADLSGRSVGVCTDWNCVISEFIGDLALVLLVVTKAFNELPELNIPLARHLVLAIKPPPIVSGRYSLHRRSKVCRGACVVSGIRVRLLPFFHAASAIKLATFHVNYSVDLYSKYL